MTTRENRRNSPDAKLSPVDCSHHRKQLKVWWHFFSWKKQTHAHTRVQDSVSAVNTVEVCGATFQKATLNLSQNIQHSFIHDERNRLADTPTQHQTRRSKTVQHLHKENVPDVAKRADSHDILMLHIHIYTYQESSLKGGEI